MVAMLFHRSVGEVVWNWAGSPARPALARVLVGAGFGSFS